MTINWRRIATSVGIGLAILVAGFALGRVIPKAPAMASIHRFVSGEDVVLPLPEPPFAGRISARADQSEQAMPVRVAPPQNAPNVFLVMTDDVGFAASSTFGGPVPTPNLDALAQRGVRYTQFHTTAMCTPSRAALLTGRNQHRVGAGVVSEQSSGYPGYNSAIPRSAATIGRVLTGYGYNTAFFGKHHNTPIWEASAAGPFDHWPTGLGFEYFYGFIGGDTDQFSPVLYRGTSRIDLSNAPSDLILDRAMADDAIHWMRVQHGSAPDKPFLIYYAPGTAHAPHQAPEDWIARFRGQFDQGWDRVREETLARQIEMGIAPPGTTLSQWPEGVPHWNELTPTQRQVAARFMETYAGTLAYQDAQFGRIFEEMRRLDVLDDTLIIFINGDNGASAEGGISGTMNEIGHLANQVVEDDAWLAASQAEMGGPRSYQTYPVGWTVAMNTPFRWTKQVASHLGGTRNGAVVSWPSHLRARGEIRTQFHHLVDVYPTILEAAGLRMPTMVDGARQLELDGVSMMPSLRNARAPENHRTQYFEILGSRGIYHDGYMAGTTPLNPPWASDAPSTTLDESQAWELYDLRSDFSQSRNLAASEPERLREMQALFAREAERNNVYPLNPQRGTARMDSLLFRFAVASPFNRQGRYVYSGQGYSIMQSDAPPLFARDYTIDIDAIIPQGGGSGALIGYGSWFGGWSFYLDQGRPAVRHAFSQQPRDQFSIIAPRALPAGRARIRYEFRYDGGGMGRGGAMRIFVNGQRVAEGRIERQITVVAGLGETFDLGDDTAAPVLDYPGGRARFNGEIERIEVRPGQMKLLPF
ncbi:MAG: arylsulfatase [Hyphomonadaceae bacterium]|nr:arylsulfatase [Hyphomonadaceae bacterium]